MSDPFTDKEWERYADRVLGDLIPKLRDSAVVVSLVPRGRADVKLAVELGFSIMLDKPIIAVVQPGTPIPAKLMAVADAVIEGSANDPTLQDRLRVALTELLGKDWSRGAEIE